MKLSALILGLALPAMSFAQSTRILASGLNAPQRLVLTRSGNFLVSETSKDAASGRISYVTRSGMRRSLLTGLPSGTSVANDASGPTGLALDRANRTLYIAIGGGDAERSGERPGTAMFNPEGFSSPLFSSVLKVGFDMDVDAIPGTFSLSKAEEQRVADGYEVTLSNAGATARIRSLTQFPNAVVDPVSVYRFSNPYGMELTPDERTLYLADASRNALFRIDAETGRYQKVAGFAAIPNPLEMGPPFVDAVPTSVHRCGGRLLVGFLTGFPFAPGLARVWAVNTQTGASLPVVANLTSVVDTACVGNDIYVVEFSQNMLEQRAGRVLRTDGGSLIPVAEMPVPVSAVADPGGSALYVLTLTGNIAEVRLQ